MPHDISHLAIVKNLSEEWHLGRKQRRLLESLGEEATLPLLEIQQTLSTVFAHNPMLGELWLTTPNRAFAEKTPMEVIETEKLPGLMRVMHFLCLNG